MVNAPPMLMFQFASLRGALRFQKEQAERGLPSIRAETGSGCYVVAVRPPQPGASVAPRAKP